MNWHRNFIKSNVPFFFLYTASPTLPHQSGLSFCLGYTYMSQQFTVHTKLFYFLYKLHLYNSFAMEGVLRRMLQGTNFSQHCFSKPPKFHVPSLDKIQLLHLSFAYIFLITHSYAIINLNKMCESYYLIVGVRKT